MSLTKLSLAGNKLPSLSPRKVWSKKSRNLEKTLTLQRLKTFASNTPQILDRVFYKCWKQLNKMRVFLAQLFKGARAWDFFTLVFYHHSILYGKDILCAKKFLKLLFITTVFHFSKNTCMPSLRLQVLHKHWAYAYNLYTYTEHTHTNWLGLHFRNIFSVF